MAAAAEDDVEDQANVEFDHGTNGVEVDPDPATAAADAPPRDGFQLLLCLTVESGNGYTCCACGKERRVDLPPPLLPLPGGPNVAEVVGVRLGQEPRGGDAARASDGAR